MGPHVSGSHCTCSVTARECLHGNFVHRAARLAGLPLRSGPPDVGLLQDALHGFYPGLVPRMELGGADAVTAEQDRPEALGVASACAGDDADEAGVMPQGLLEEIQYRAFLNVVAAPPAATRRGRRRG